MGGIVSRVIVRSCHNQESCVLGVQAVWLRWSLTEELFLPEDASCLGPLVEKDTGMEGGSEDGGTHLCGQLNLTV